MNYKIIAIVAAAAGTMASVFSQSFHKKAIRATDALTVSAQKLKRAEDARREAEESLRALIRTEGDLSEKDIQQLKIVLEKYSEELSVAKRNAGDSEKRLDEKIQALTNTLEKRQAQIRKLEQELGVKNRWTPQDIAQLDDFIAGATMVSNFAPTQFKHNQMLLLGLLEEIKGGAPIDTTIKESKGQTALHIACAMGRLEEVTWLLNHGASVNILSDSGATPLDCLQRGTYNEGPIRAIMSAHGAMLSRSSSSSTFATEDRSDLQPMIDRMAALCCREATSALYQKRLLTLLPLIRDGADIDITLPETKGNTALHYACGIGSLSITRWLVEHGANVNALTNKGVTPLDCVGADNARQISALLISNGAIKTR